jgi:hypothetical protein
MPNSPELSGTILQSFVLKLFAHKISSIGVNSVVDEAETREECVPVFAGGLVYEIRGNSEQAVCFLCICRRRGRLCRLRLAGS